MVHLVLKCPAGNNSWDTSNSEGGGDVVDMWLTCCHAPLQPGEEYRQGNCDVIQGHFRPFLNGPPSEPDYDQVCGRNMTGGCEVGDLTGKHDQITVAGELIMFEQQSR